MKHTTTITTFNSDYTKQKLWYKNKNIKCPVKNYNVVYIFSNSAGV